ncbi:MAG: YaeQ family protein [Planctomycetota bacterium]|nr:YaeQ family protein [Planctomycetota bacterium]
MGNTSVVFRFQVELSDIDRGVYESLDLRVAQHPSEEEDRMVVRVLARALAHQEGLEFGRGLSNPEEPAMWAYGLTGLVETWIDVGLPAAERLHKASKASAKLLIFTTKPTDSLTKEWRKRKIHRADEIQVHRLDPKFVADLVRHVDRRTTWYVTVQDHVLSVGVGDLIMETQVEQITLGSLCSTAPGA